MRKKLQVILSYMIVVVMVSLTPLQTFAIVLNGWDSRTFNEFEPQASQWEGVTPPTLEEARNLLDAHYPDNFRQNVFTNTPIASQQMTLQTI